MTVNVRPAIVIVPVRGLLPLFLLTFQLTVPLPVPVSPAVIVIQEAFEVAVHVQPAAVETDTSVPFCALLLSVSLDALIEYVHPVDCVTVWVCPATEMVAVRAGPELAATVKSTLPLPFPLAPDVMVIHVAAVVAVHPQPAGAVTPIGVPAPPALAIDWLAALIDDVHEPA